MNKICIVTATRAEYGLLRNLIRKVEGDKELELELVVTGTHLSEEYGYTIKEIKEDGYPIAAQVDILVKNNLGVDIIRTMAAAMEKFGVLLKDIRPDMLVVLGDRYELLPICETALMLKIPITHISGGEITEGALDDTIRHCITKMSNLHFPGCEEYRKRIIQMGEEPYRVFNYGDIGVENIMKMEYMELPELEESLQMSLDVPYACVTFHPATLEQETPKDQVSEMLAAFEMFGEMKFIFTGSNADEGGEEINRLVKEFTKYRKNCRMYASLGVRRYLSLLRRSAMIIGNSSSGIVEAPCFCVPTVNIGNRQKGRLQAESIINCKPQRNSIVDAMKRAMNPEFLSSLKNMKNPYGNGETSDGIIKEMKNYLSGGGNPGKHFYDL